MTYYFCDFVEYKPTYEFHIVLLAFLTGIFVAQIVNFMTTIQRGAYISVLALAVIALALALSMPKNHTLGVKDEL
jgi:hypothetical protein